MKTLTDVFPRVLGGVLLLLCQTPNALLHFSLGQGQQQGTSPVLSNKDLYLVPHTSLVGKVAGTWFSCGMRGTSLDELHPSEPSNCPPFVSSFALIELWHRRCLPDWLLLRLTSHRSCFSGLANSRSSGLTHETETRIHSFSAENAAPALKNTLGQASAHQFIRAES